MPDSKPDQPLQPPRREHPHGVGPPQREHHQGVGYPRRGRISPFYQGLLSSGLQGFVFISCTAPIERIKILMQVSSASRTITAVGGFRSMTECFYRCYYQQGLRSLWRGYSATLLIHFPSQILTFAANETFRDTFVRGIDRKQKTRLFTMNVISGAVAGASVLLLIYPVSFCRTRLAADIGRVRSEREFTSLWNCARTIYKQDGVKGLYRGFFIAVMGIIVYRGVYFGCYDTFNGFVQRRYRNFIVHAATGASLGALAGLLSYPFDVLHRQMQMQSGSNHRSFSGAVDCIKTVAVTEGYRGFYRGLLPAVLTGLLTSSLYGFYQFAVRRN